MFFSRFVVLPSAFALSFSFANFQCSNGVAPVLKQTEEKIPFSFDKPDQTFVLEDKALIEISGLSATDQKDIFCAIADEKGEVFWMDAKQGFKIVNRVKFRDSGDFEGIEMVGNAIYTIKSDGEIYALRDWNNPEQIELEFIETPLRKENDVEGLGYDARTNSLLIAAKEDPESPVERKIWAFDLSAGTFSTQPRYVIDVQALNRRLPLDENDKKNRFLSPSGISIDPVTHHLYVLSSALKRLLILDSKTGDVIDYVRLDRDILQQPEGITFDAEGNLWMSSEGKDGGMGQVLKFIRHVR